MLLKKWEDLPKEMKNETVRPYYDILKKKRVSLVLKRSFDILVSILLLIVLVLPLMILSLLIRIDSPGPALFRQKRITQYGKIFRIYKFRTMVQNAEQLGSQVTTNQDSRVTKIGGFLRKYRLDELPQLLNILIGDMSFVGTRPEVLKYVEQYTDEMFATLLMPAGVTSQASIQYKDEARLLEGANSPDDIYVNIILPKKMQHNLNSIRNFSFINDCRTMLQTIFAVIH